MDEVEYVRELRFERHTRPLARDADADRRAAAALAAVSRPTPPRTRRQPASSPTKHSRSVASSPPVTAPKSPPIPVKTKTTRSTAKPVAKQDGDPAALPSKRPSPPGRPFQKGNREQSKARRPLTTDEIREITRSAMTKVSLRRLVRRLGQIADTAPPREAIAASRMLLDLIGEGEIGRNGSPVATTGAVITIPTAPERQG